MATEEFPIEPKPVAPVKIAHRVIQSSTLPVKESLPILNMLRANKPFSIHGQPPVIWDRGEGVHIYDPYGNMWLNWSSGVLVANAGHGCREICDAVIAEAQKGLLMFAPVGRGGGTVKISPPLCINADAMDEGLDVLGEVIDELLK